MGNGRGGHEDLWKESLEPNCDREECMVGDFG